MDSENIRKRREAKLPKRNPLETERENLKLKEKTAALEERQAVLEEKSAQLEEESNTDHLTGVLNRRAFERFLDEAIEQFRANKEHNEEYVLSVLAFDIDHFKRKSERK